MSNDKEIPAESRGGGREVLVIEDDQFLRDILHKEFNKMGFMTFAAIEAGKAFEILEQQKISLILLDILLPGVDGFTILQTLKNTPKYRDIPVLVLTNLNEPADKEKALTLGAVDCMVKAHHTTDEIVSKSYEILGIK